ncbi:TetR/AcrR family transcriptional regulator [Parahaliea sp. F7430]|uniref:TetR/AcrR family transcriptional regulator n=1 Tax=Sediminihaliea albiluteola TaxID=2758564 RepID=A0A7W2TV51_9GAMM|nr:TetR/AcrR family transcriptional regulator [Sediminihaliea albiluteola]MBA6412524.1 TetR/AcrR family transcriptional regulator [Sediminihaliea albiluteola]
MPKIVDHQEQRLQLAATVAEVVAQIGLEHTTLRTVAAHHGCTKGMVQHYFSDKEALLLSAIHFVEQQSALRVEAAAEGLSGLDHLHSRLLAQLPLTAALLNEWRVRLSFITLASQVPAVQSLLEQRQQLEQSQAMRALRQAQRSGELRSGITLLKVYRVLAAAIYGLAAIAVANGGQWSPMLQKQLLKSMIDDLRS